MVYIILYILIYTFNIKTALFPYWFIYEEANLFFCAITNYFPFILFKSNRVWFGKYKSEISFVFSVTKETFFYSIFYNRIMNYELNSLLFVNLGFNI